VIKPAVTATGTLGKYAATAAGVVKSPDAKDILFYLAGLRPSSNGAFGGVLEILPVTSAAPGNIKSKSAK
jgi:hypothetical protein